MSFSEYISPLVGRLVLAWYFAIQALNYIGTWSETIALMEFRHAPAPAAVLAVGILLLGMGSASLALGYQIRYGAMMLFAVTLVVTVTMHDFWTINKPSDRLADYQFFSRDIAIAGALLILVGMGPGGVALDNRKKKR